MQVVVLVTVNANSMRLKMPACVERLQPMPRNCFTVEAMLYMQQTCPTVFPREPTTQGTAVKHGLGTVAALVTMV